MSSHVERVHETVVEANGISLACDTFGDASDPPVLLIAGLGMQMIGWDDVFCFHLAAQDYWVIRFDNRDCGHSTHFDDAPVPSIPAVALAMAEGREPEVPYTLRDMADDAAALLEALGVGAAHVVGVSMGGMIAQLMAIHHPQRVRSLVSIMSTTGGRDLPPPQPEAAALLMEAPPADREANLEHALRSARIMRGPHLTLDEARVRRRAAEAYDRAFYPAGTGRQLAAVVASGSRRGQLAQVAAPTLVIHGAADPLVPVEGGRDTARHVPGAELLIFEKMGHDLPPQLWPPLIQAIAHHAIHAEAEGSSVA